MQPKILSKQLLLPIILLWLILFIIFFSYFTQKELIYNQLSSSLKSILTPSEIEAISIGLPVRLEIPKIKVDAVVKYVGLTSGGAINVPKNPAEVAWFNLGPPPGYVGNSIMVGHYGWENSLPAVFDNLYQLKLGDKIFVEDDKGLINTFVVREIKIYNKDDQALVVFDSSDGKAHLNLITCTGPWDKTLGSRSSRLVVFTDLE